MRTRRVFVSLVTVLTLAGACAPFQIPKKQIGRVGSITGTVSWESGSAEDLILKAQTITLRETTGGVNIVNAPVTMGPRTGSGGRVSTHYSIVDLPVGVPIHVIVGSTAFGAVGFERDTIPPDALCTLEAATVSDFDFHAVAFPIK